MPSNVKIAVISDLHCRYGDGKHVDELFTYLTSDLLNFPVYRNPVAALKKLIRDNQITIDALICPGDITDKVDRQGLVSGWKYLEELKVAMSGKILAATIGNHDVDSRKISSSDPNDVLKRLSETFPTEFENANTNYWANHFCLLEEKNYDILLVNSSYSHIDDKLAGKSLIDDTTLQLISESLSKIKNNNKVKIAVCHHHPLKHSNMDYKDEDSIDKGDELLKMLEDNEFSIVIHGHKHDPRLVYSNSLPVFAAGSFSSIMNVMNTGAENTFHIVEIDTASKKGTIKSWIYGPKDGWIQKDGTYFPCLTGFGARKNIKEFASDCAKWIQDQSSDFVHYDNLVKQFPDLLYLIPDEQKKFNEYISALSISLIPELPNSPKMVLKSYK